MKKIMTPERFKGLKSSNEVKRELVKGYQETLDYLTVAVGSVATADEALLAAALERFADALKGDMSSADYKIYKDLKRLKVKSINAIIKEEK